MFERLGIAEEMKAKTKVQASPAAIPQAVAKGEAELGIFLINVLIAPGVDFAGPFPAEVQQELVFTAAASADTKDIDGAKALIAFLKSLVAGRQGNGPSHVIANVRGRQFRVLEEPT